MNGVRGLVMSLLLVGFVWAMDPNNQGIDHGREVPGRFNEVVCMICRDDFREFAHGRVAEIFACGHWVCSDCRHYITAPKCPLCQMAIPVAAHDDDLVKVDALMQRMYEPQYDWEADGEYVDEGMLDDAQELTPLHEAVRDGNVARAQMLIDGGADVNATDHNGRTPLHYAASSGDRAMVRLLIREGADVDATDRNNWTPVSIARSNDHPDIARLLRTSTHQ